MFLLNLPIKLLSGILLLIIGHYKRLKLLLAIFYHNYVPKYFFNENILIIFVSRIFSQQTVTYCMPRRIRPRKVVAPPSFRGYKPYGTSSNVNDFIELLYEEYEAIKLADYDLLNHQQAAEIMGISRPTFARIYENARRKIALALVETKEIKTVFGNAWMDKSWFECTECHARFTIPKNLKEHNCPLCSSKNIELLTNKN